MSVRIIGAVCIVAALAGCAKSSDEPPEVSADVMASQGYDAYNRGDYRDAVTYFEDALEVAPDNAFAMQGLAASLDSVTYFGERSPVRRSPEIEAAVYRVSLRGYEAYERGDLAEANAHFRTVLDMEPANRYALRGVEAVQRKVVRRDIANETIAATATTYSDTTEARTAVTEMVAEVAPVLSYDTPVTAEPDGGAYVSVGSYDSYVAATDGAVPLHSGN